MKTAQEKIAEFLAKKGATVCPPADSFEAQAGSIRQARREHEAGPLDIEDEGDLEVQQMENGAQARYLEIQGVGR